MSQWGSNLETALVAGAGAGTRAGGKAATTGWLVEVDSTDGPVTVVTPPGSIDGRRLRWPFPLTGYGNDPPTWSSA